jgi:hypothetical protein
MNVSTLIPGNANSKPSSFRGGAKEKQMIHSLFYEVQTEDTIVPLLQVLAPPSRIFRVLSLSLRRSQVNNLILGIQLDFQSQGIVLGVETEEK